MVDTNHRDLTGVALHEPKGIASANAGENYIADGSGSGAWTASTSQAGVISMWPTATPPTGWLECDGASVSTTTEAAIFAVIAYTYGGSGANFNLPDYRGHYVRGMNGSSDDPDSATRTDRGDGTTGNNVGCKQASALRSHTHTYNAPNGNTTAGAGGQAVANIVVNGTASGAPVGGTISSSETRGRNVLAMFIIKK